MKRIAILYGGKSGEHEVSLLSAASIVRHLDTSRFQAVLIGVSKDGVWSLQEPSVFSLAREAEGPLALEAGKRVYAAPGRGLVVETAGGTEELACDLVFPVLHGSFGEDGTIQGLLEVAELAYVGAGVLGSALGMDKEKAKALWAGSGLPVVPWIAVRSDELRDIGALAREAGERFGWPCFVKPSGSGSSVGTSKVAEAAALAAALRAALEWDEKALIEPFVVAREIECAVLGGPILGGSSQDGAAQDWAEPIAFDPGEVVPSHEFYDYEAKYLDPEGARLEVPAKIPEAAARRVRELAVAAFKACELSGMARVDFFMDKRKGEILLNEVNSIPGFTQISMYPRMCEAGGLSYPDLITRLAELALARRAEREKLRFMRQA
jgi:D-alanine-D-alanine ligase